jgi:CPA1 family monovalent cation:H+ antiporter
VRALDLVLGLLVVVAILSLLARRLHVPYPIVLVLGGLGLGFVPGLPRITLADDVVFLVFLPPLVYAAGWFTSVRDFKANLRSISLLSVGLVVATMACVAVLAHTAIPGLPWAAAFVLGAIVSPTDTVAASAIFERLRAPRRIVAVVEGESLLNDAAGLIGWRYAVAAVVVGSFSLWQAGLNFVFSGVGGVAIGLGLSWLLIQLQRRLQDPVIEITLTFLVPYGIYLAAQGVGVSGVLAVAAAGIYAGSRSTDLFSATTRIQAFAVWGTVLFVLNGLIFVLIGLQLPGVLSRLGGRSPAQLVAYAALISASVVAVRILWVYPAAYLPRLLSRRLRERDPYPGWRNVAVVSWTGMRGVVSLAAALALPATVSGGGPFPGRDLILFLTFSVILSTLVVQGLSLPFLMRWLGVADDGEAARQEEADARTRAIDAAVARLDELAREDWTRDEAIAYMRAYYGKRQHTVNARFGRIDHEHQDGGHAHEPGRDHAQEHRDGLTMFNRLKQEMLNAERWTVLALRNQGTIGDDVQRRIERDLDLEEVRLVEA